MYPKTPPNNETKRCLTLVLQTLSAIVNESEKISLRVKSMISWLKENGGFLDLMNRSTIF